MILDKIKNMENYMVLTFDKIKELHLLEVNELKIETYMDKDLKNLKEFNVSHSSNFIEIEGSAITGGKIKQKLAASIQNYSN